MKRIFAPAVAALVLSSLADFRAPARPPREAVPGFLLLEAESFSSYGKWRLDTQFVHKMGSAYLVAPGVGEPVGAATTSVEIPRPGRWRVWARTKDWLPEFSPGRFALEVDGVRGKTLGASRRVGWGWENAGDFSLDAGSVQVALVDLSGAFARCDALVFTTDLAYVPPEDDAALRVERLRLAGEDGAVADRGDYDVVVVGAGPGGFNAAIAAARGGARVALVGDRPVLGGNASDEIGVNMCGAAESHMAGRETGLAEEALCLASRHPGPGMSSAYRAMADGEKNLRVFYNTRMVEVEKAQGRVAAIVCRDTLTGARSRMRGKIFVDATGDGWLGYFAGAEYREGREGQREFGEACAPERPDTLTMSGLLHEPKIGVCFRGEDTGRPVPYAVPAWADVLPRNFTRHVVALRGEWWVEHSGFFDDCADPERARDELVRISFAYWGWLKNRSRLKYEAANWRLAEIPILAGRRESRRLVGDCILDSNGCLAGRTFPDGVAFGGWPLDTHDPLGMSAPESDGYWLRHPNVPIYAIPYRALYSTNVPNLFMAGRDISATHIALGSTRVQQTCATIGQAVGTAAAMCAADGLSPRELGQRKIRVLQRRLVRDDAYVPGLADDDPDNVARTALATASSSEPSYKRFTPLGKYFDAADGIVYTNASPSAVIDGVTRPLGREAHLWVSAPTLPQWIRLDFPKPTAVGEIRLTFDTNLELPARQRPCDPALVRAYEIEGSEDGERWFPLAREDDNFLRLRVHRFPPKALKAVRVTVTATYGEKRAFVYEIRAYSGSDATNAASASCQRGVR